jgi:uncharacterized Zn finger protein
MRDGFFTWRRPRSAARRRSDAERRLAAATRSGTPLSPVAIAGRAIARTFWGKAWCDNLERYRDFAYRLERGRSYVRGGAVIDLQIEAGKIRAKVSGSSLYDVAIDIDAVAPDAWRAIRRDCAGSIGSRLDLLAGTLSEAVMSRLCADRIGLFPAPSAIRFTCSCPDYAIMCKHVAAAMYGVGARLDHAPELLFALRRASVDDLVTSALSELPSGSPRSPRALATGPTADGLAALFGIDLADSAVRSTTAPVPPSAASAPTPKPRAAPKAKATPRTKPGTNTAPPVPVEVGATSRSRARTRSASPAPAHVSPARRKPEPPARKPEPPARKPEPPARKPRRGAPSSASSARPAANTAGGTTPDPQFERAVLDVLRQAARAVRRR